MKFDYNREYNTFLYFLLKPLVTLLCRIVYDFRCIGKENIPEGGKLIIASNHKAFSDPAVILGSFKGEIHFMAKGELFEKGIFALFFRHMGAFPVKRNTADRFALRYALGILEKGGTLGIFPEGRRVRGDVEPENFKNGIGFIAYHSGADILPCCIYKTDNGFRSRVTLIFGEIIPNEALFPDKEKTSVSIRRASETVITRIKELWKTQEKH